jgi:hypothetical protein
MDQPVIIHTASTSREAVRDARGQVIGYLESQRLTGKIAARDARGIIVGVYDTRSDLTRDAAGRVVGRGYLLSSPGTPSAVSMSTAWAVLYVAVQVVEEQAARLPSPALRSLLFAGIVALAYLSPMLCVVAT